MKFIFPFSHITPGADGYGDEAMFSVECSATFHKQSVPGSYLDGEFVDIDIIKITQVSGPATLIFTDDKIYQRIEKEAEEAAYQAR